MRFEYEFGDVADENNDLVARVEMHEHGTLLAAAPELLAACEKLASIAEEFKAGARSGYHMGTISQAMDLALAAITRAKGAHLD